MKENNILCISNPLARKSNQKIMVDFSSFALGRMENFQILEQ